MWLFVSIISLMITGIVGLLLSSSQEPDNTPTQARVEAWMRARAEREKAAERFKS